MTETKRRQESSCENHIAKLNKLIYKKTTGIMVNLFVCIRQAPPLVDTFIVPEVPDCLYTLFDYGLMLQIELRLLFLR